MSGLLQDVGFWSGDLRISALNAVILSVLSFLE